MLKLRKPACDPSITSLLLKTRLEEHIIPSRSTSMTVIYCTSINSSKCRSACCLKDQTNMLSFKPQTRLIHEICHSIYQKTRSHTQTPINQSIKFNLRTRTLQEPVVYQGKMDALIHRRIWHHINGVAVRRDGGARISSPEIGSNFEDHCVGLHSLPTGSKQARSHRGTSRHKRINLESGQSGGVDRGAKWRALAFQVGSQVIFSIAWLLCLDSVELASGDSGVDKNVYLTIRLSILRKLNSVFNGTYFWK